ncbi:MAG: polyprenyl diphosphate synthase [Kiritimatiellae bacterium]|nr:polyprenyl diphosphate synthase [Kiritimatiellia bacterium]
MDGNGRWALQRGLPRLAGHRQGAKQLEEVLTWCAEVGVEILTVYAFSTENWKRPLEEVSGLMKLLGLFLREKRAKLLRDQVRFRVIGRRSDLPEELQKKIEALEAETAGFKRQLVVALSYGGRAEIVDAARRFAALPADQQNEAGFASCLYAPDLPDPDLIIRTSGELRLSNFLLWECAYSEFYITDTFWPDFDRAAFDQALASYATRDRRKGGHA